MVGRDISPLFFPFDHFTYKLRLSLNHGQTFTLVLWFCLAFRYILWDSNASVNSSSAHPPPGQPPGISIFFKKWQIPGGGDKQVRQMLRVGTKKEGKCSTPRII